MGEVTSPRPGDRLILDGDAFVVQGKPQRDREAGLDARYEARVKLKLDISPDLVAMMAAEIAAGERG